MSTEQKFNPGDVEPAKVNFIDDNINVQDEHLAQSTPAKVEDTPVTPVAPVAQAPDTSQPVHAEPQDSDERYRNLQAAYTKVSQENSELRNRLDRLEAGQAQPTPQQQFIQPQVPTPAEPDELDTVAKEFPELEPIASRMKELQQKMNEQSSNIEQQRESLDSTVRQTAQEKQDTAILTAHSDAIQINQSVDFQGWLARQPSYMQPWMRTGTAEQVIDLLSAYKRAAGNQQQQQPPAQDPLDEARIAGAPGDASAPIINNGDSGNKKRWTKAEIDSMSYAEFEIHEAELDLAAREGRID